MAIEPNIKTIFLQHAARRQKKHLKPPPTSRKQRGSLHFAHSTPTSLPATCAASSFPSAFALVQRVWFYGHRCSPKEWILIWILTSKIPKDFKNIQVAGWLCIMNSLAKKTAGCSSNCCVSFEAPVERPEGGNCIKQKLIHT